MAGDDGSLRAGSAGGCGFLGRAALDGTQRSEEKQGITILDNSIAFSK